MRKPFFLRGPLVLFGSCLVCLLTLPLSGQRTEQLAHPVPAFHDWSTRHVIYARVGPMAAMLAAQRDPRAMFTWRKWFGMPVGHRFEPILGGRPEPGLAGLHNDWSINLGAGGTAANMYPAKFSFDVTAAPSCANDFVIYPVAAIGSGTQPNLVAFNNLYSGTGAGGTGSCNRTPVHDDAGTSATVLWSYNIKGITGGGAVTTSPVIAYDLQGGPVTGTAVAFVESATGSPAHFHVLAWKDGDGQDTTDADGLQNTLLPKTINTFVTAAPVAGSGTATDLPLGTATTGTDTRSSPFVDYVNDVAYVGNDIGVLYRIKDVFCVSSNPDCPGSTKPAPSQDTTWGSGGSISVCSGMLTAAVEDSVTHNVFVGCSDGKLYGFNSSGTPLSPASITVGNGSTPFGGIVDPPIVDGVNGLVYAVSGSNGTNPVLVQTNTTFSTFAGESGNTNTATLGVVPSGDTATYFGTGLHAPTVNDAYFSSGTSASWLMLVCAPNNTAGQGYVTLYGVGFNAAREMNTGTPTATGQLAGYVDTCSPLTEFLNPNEAGTNPTTAAPTDWLFIGRTQENGAQNVGDFRSYNMDEWTSSDGLTGFVATGSGSVPETGGTSGIVVDNDSTNGQASSVYFSTLGSAACNVGGTGLCAVKLTQLGLN